MKTWMKPFALMAVLAVASAGCEDGTTNSNDLDDDVLLADAALVAADGMFQDVAHMASPGTWGGFGVGPEAGPIEVQGTRTFTRTVTFFPGPDYDAETTTHMQIVSDLTRQVTHTFWSADIVRHRDMTVSGLEGEETSRTWDGTSTGDVFKSRHPDEGEVRTYDMESTGNIAGVVRNLPRAENPWPVAGTITRTIHVIRKEGDETIVDKIVNTSITFDGNQVVTMIVDDGSGPVEYEVDLAERNVKKRFKRKGG